MTTEHKAFKPHELKVLNKDEGIVETIVAVTGVEDRVNDIFEIGAFEKSLAKIVPKGVWSHDMTVPTSRTIEAKELRPGDGQLPDDWPEGGGGLYIKAQYNMGTQAGREAFSNCQFYGDEQEWSVGYTVNPAATHIDKKTGVRHIGEADIFEYSQVVFGAMPLAQSISVKSLPPGFTLTGPDGSPVKVLPSGEVVPDLAEHKGDIRLEDAIGDWADVEPEGIKNHMIYRRPEELEAKNMGLHLVKGSLEERVAQIGYAVSDQLSSDPHHAWVVATFNSTVLVGHEDIFRDHDGHCIKVSTTIYKQHEVEETDDGTMLDDGIEVELFGQFRAKGMDFEIEPPEAIVLMRKEVESEASQKSIAIAQLEDIRTSVGEFAETINVRLDEWAQQLTPPAVDDEVEPEAIVVEEEVVSPSEPEFDQTAADETDQAFTGDPIPEFDQDDMDTELAELRSFLDD